MLVAYLVPWQAAGAILEIDCYWRLSLWVTWNEAVFALEWKLCVHSLVAEVSLCGFVKLLCSTNFLICSTGIQSFTAITTSTASLTLKALLDFELTTSYELYLRITDTSNGWTGNVTIKVNEFWSFILRVKSNRTLLWPTVYGSQREYEMQKVARIKGPRKKKGKGQESNSERTNRKKRKSKFWLMRTRQTKMLYIFVPNLRKFIFLVKKNIAFPAKLRPI